MLTSNSSRVTNWPYSIREGYLLLFLAFVTLGVYYPAILGDFCFVDDIGDLNRAVNYSWQDITNALTTSRRLQRFMSNIIYFTLYKLFGDAPIHFHLSNVLFHLGSGLCIYCLVKNLQDEESRSPWPSLLAALLFLLHPVNVEAVAWITGRNTVIASFFALLALSFHARVQKDLKDWRLWLAGLCYLFSVFSYEIGLVLCLFIAMWDLQDLKGLSIQQAVKNCYRRWLPYIMVTSFWLLLRLVAIWQASGRVGQVPHKAASFDLESISKVLINPIAGLGFYLKKMFFPWPLSFHIERIVKMPYFLLGLAFVVLLGYGIWKCKWQALWGVGFLCGLLPVLILTYAPRSWSPLAERYSYFASVFFAVFVGLLYAKHMSQRWLSRHSWVKILPFVVVFIFGVGAARRTPVWQSNETLLADTYQKSNGNGWVAATYGVMCLSRGKEREAEEYLKKALENGPVSRAAFGLGMLEESRGNYEKAEEYYLKAAWPSSKVHEWRRSLEPDVYKTLGRLHFSRAIKDKENSTHHYERSVHFFGRAYEFSGKDPMILYNLGKVYLKQGDLERARDCFRQVWEEVPDTYYGKAAGKLMKVN
jgi:tetratricopeptide (TPR) repeat protein